ncbi:50S ribosomal protein L11 methyltransferase [Petrotoga sp. 9PWA.NaAc.5.4]|uniref:50S ribosomal protein L11 methyltransferase n=1 Tax=Petrotoga sp. 9PWA.NaAc.5.4 TaxID=1434328 RepID=UPI000CAB6BB4|nr:50S ribosomal protein L11 methyltransferase [Petrotoga sp. 9PWA.NaAc.5.4]PNR96292.1 hypothetical protein X924_02855 [Petrotoga sp. 9PWA.NaAc.5.4]
MDKYHEYIFEIDKKSEERLIDYFIEKNFNSYYIENDIENSKNYLRIYFKEGFEDKEMLEFLSKFNGKLISNIKIEEKQWLEQWIKSIKVFEFIEGVWVNPFEDKIVEKPGLVLNVIPGSAFGTGLHITTKLAAKFLKEIDCEDKRVLDVGTGSGILSVLSKKLGAKYVCALDYDPLAVEKAKETFKINNVDVDIRQSDLLSAIDENERFDILVSNIVAEVLIDLMKDPKFNKILATKANVVFSGIIDSKEKVLLDQAKRNKLELKRRLEDGSWVSLWFQKKI